MPGTATRIWSSPVRIQSRDEQSHHLFARKNCSCNCFFGAGLVRPTDPSGPRETSPPVPPTRRFWREPLPVPSGPPGAVGNRRSVGDHLGPSDLVSVGSSVRRVLCPLDLVRQISTLSGFERQDSLMRRCLRHQKRVLPRTL